MPSKSKAPAKPAKPVTRLGPYEFACSKCGKVHKAASYAVAQTAAGHVLHFTGCDCGGTTEITRATFKR